MRSCLALWLEQGDEERLSVVEASAASKKSILVERCSCRSILLLHIGLASRILAYAQSACNRRVGWAKARPSHTLAFSKLARRAHARGCSPRGQNRSRT